MLVIQELIDGEYTVIGEVHDGVPDDSVAGIFSEDEWEEYDEDDLLQLLDGPRIIAVQPDS